ncbi:MAG: hypothetical protein KatS3mg113_0685 [Planctomycetaceae bacterium]|nr:MAG: hypothetical protein KatS3mg113_0685 [Planctomycetaceae bacterium]
MIHTELLLAQARGWSSEPGYAVGWMTLALINAGLAQSKNRSGLMWWLISLFLGPIATFLLVAFCDRLPPTS